VEARHRSGWSPRKPRQSGSHETDLPAALARHYLSGLAVWGPLSSSQTCHPSLARWLVGLVSICRCPGNTSSIATPRSGRSRGRGRWTAF
jgi:hypothetical protein